MKNVNWEAVQDEIPMPKPGGYIAKIIGVEDIENKEYLAIRWDFAEGEFKGTNQATFDSLGFWPTLMICSYKDKALRFFKGFKTAVEASNRNYTFRNDPQSLVGKYVGVVLGEEEYIKKSGEIGTRLYVAEKRSGKAIRDNDYTVPELKKLERATSPTAENQQNSFAILDDNDALPF